MTIPKSNGKIAVVTGAGSGIGKAVSMSLALSGTHVCLVGRNMRKLEEIKRQEKDIESRFVCYQADLSSDDDLRKLSKRIKSHFKSIDVLIHSAGVISMGEIENSSMQDFDKQFAINVRAPYYLTQRLLPLLKQPQGQVVFINSSVALRNATGMLSLYTMTKYALRAFADSLRAEVNSHGVRVITIYPGQTATPMQRKIRNLEGRVYEPETLLQPEDIAKTVMDILNTPRTSEITDVSIRPFTKPVG